jgi:hypothetical protein
MPDDSGHDDAEIIRSAYAERVRETFKIFAENLAVGQAETSCRDNFKRAMQLMRKTRDLALQAITEEFRVELRSAPREGTAASEEMGEQLSPEDQALVDQALAGTTGHAAPAPVSRYRGR